MTCPTPALIANGAPFDGMCDGTYGSVCTFAGCVPGYTPSATGVVNRTCAQQGLYTGASRTCLDIEACNHYPCSPYAACNEILGGPNSTSGRSCGVCQSGYSGDGETCVIDPSATFVLPRVTGTVAVHEPTVVELRFSTAQLPAGRVNGQFPLVITVTLPAELQNVTAEITGAPVVVPPYSPAANLSTAMSGVTTVLAQFEGGDGGEAKIELGFRVADVSGVSISNVFNVDASGEYRIDERDPVDASLVLSLVVIEPKLSITQSVEKVGVVGAEDGFPYGVVDAGDVFKFSVDVANPPGRESSAYDVEVEIQLPTLLDMPGSLLASAICRNSCSGFSATDLGGGKFAISTDFIAPGNELQVVWESTVSAAASPGAAIKNIEVVLTRFDSAAADEPGIAGRVGDSATATAANGTVLAVVAQPTVSSYILEATSVPSTTGWNVTVGEEVTMLAVLIVPEGTTDVVLLFELPAVDGLVAAATPSVTAHGPGGLIAEITTEMASATELQAAFQCVNPAGPAVDEVHVRLRFAVADLDPEISIGTLLPLGKARLIRSGSGASDDIATVAVPPWLPDWILTPALEVGLPDLTLTIAATPLRGGKAKIDAGDQLRFTASIEHKSPVWSPCEDRWTLVYQQQSGSSGFDFTQNGPIDWTAHNMDDSGQPNFSDLVNLETYRRPDGTFSFKLHYPEDGGANVWRQTSNPMVSYSVVGYDPINITFEDNGFDGLSRRLPLNGKAAESCSALDAPVLFKKVARISNPGRTIRHRAGIGMQPLLHSNGYYHVGDRIPNDFESLLLKGPTGAHLTAQFSVLSGH